MDGDELRGPAVMNAFGELDSYSTGDGAAYDVRAGLTTKQLHPTGMHLTDNETANNHFYYFAARWYDAGVGRFVSRDALGVRRGGYPYVENAPLQFADPSGLAVRDIRVDPSWEEWWDPKLQDRAKGWVEWGLRHACCKLKYRFSLDRDSMMPSPEFTDIMSAPAGHNADLPAPRNPNPDKWAINKAIKLTQCLTERCKDPHVVIGGIFCKTKFPCGGKGGCHHRTDGKVIHVCPYHCGFTTRFLWNTLMHEFTHSCGYETESVPTMIGNLFYNP